MLEGRVLTVNRDQNLALFSGLVNRDSIRES